MAPFDTDTYFPSSLSLFGLQPGFTHKQFTELYNTLIRSDELRELAHKEWLQIQEPEYDHRQNMRWYLSYLASPNINKR